MFGVASSSARWRRRAARPYQHCSFTWVFINRVISMVAGPKPDPELKTPDCELSTPSVRPALVKRKVWGCQCVPSMLLHRTSIHRVAMAPLEAKSHSVAATIWEYWQAGRNSMKELRGCFVMFAASPIYIDFKVYSSTMTLHHELSTPSRPLVSTKPEEWKEAPKPHSPAPILDPKPKALSPTLKP